MSQWKDSSIEDVNAAAREAKNAFAFWSASSAVQRSKLLTELAQALESDRSALVLLADQESHLGAGRLNGELDRTIFQLRGFAAQVEQGIAFQCTDDQAVSGAPPIGHPALIRARVPVGPVAVFAASNFPFAFSVLGGDTASALAAGCPVIVKAHRAHRELSHRIANLAVNVVKAQGLPPGIFSMVDGPGYDIGIQLIQSTAVQAAAFTGSVRGGMALQKAVNERSRPIPFYGELGSINPVVVLPQALNEHSTELAQGLSASITMGCGQFCTSPGVIIVPAGQAGDQFVSDLVEALKLAKTHEMLTPQMRENFEMGCANWTAHQKMTPLLIEKSESSEPPKPFLMQTDAREFIANHQLHEEVFGPAALIVRVDEPVQTLSALEAVGGTLTVTIWGASQPSSEVLALVHTASQVAGRVLFSGYPTGVAVTAGQQHGGPFPSSTQAFTTSVGWSAIDRFLRPVAFQDAPEWLTARKGQPC